MKVLFASLITAIFSLGFVTTVSAQPPAEATAAEASASIPDSALELFVEAEQKVSEIRDDYQGRIGLVADQPDQAMELQQQAQQKMVEAVEDAGLAVMQYNQIAQLASTDESLRSRIQSMR